MSLRKIAVPLLSLLLFFVTNLTAQVLPNPLTIPVSISGTFGELRDGHFHSGMDYKTNAKEGYPLIAVNDGYVSRIKISAKGYGKAIYITHPNGTTSVYAHVQRFNDTIQRYVRKAHYDAMSFEIDKYPEKGKLPVRRGDIIAYSGNSGSSEGPHLHFEIRETASEKPVNPLLYGISIDDSVEPVINKIKFYPIGPNAYINGKNAELTLNVSRKSKGVSKTTSDSIEFWGNIAFGIETWDFQSNSQNKNGIYAFEIWVEDSLWFSIVWDKFGFDETRYIYALIDYKTFYHSKNRFIRTQILPNNKLSLYKKVYNKGQLNFSDYKNKRIEFIVRDFHGNKTALKIVGISVKPVMSANPKSIIPTGFLFYPDRSNSFKNNELIVEMPPEALYDTMYFDFKKTDKLAGAVSPTYFIGKSDVPVHKYFTLSIRPDSLPADKRRKAVIVFQNKKGEISSEGGVWESGYVSTKVRNFGKYAVMLDEKAPEITAINIHNKKKLPDSQKDLRFTVKDNLSGIRNYKATLNGKWVLVEYDPKNDLMFYEIDEYTKKGTNKFVLTVSDDCGNAREYSVEFEK